MALRKESIEIKKRVLSCCARLFLEQGYHQTTLSQVYKEAGISASTFQNLFHAKDGVLIEFVEVMFGEQFGAAKNIAGTDLPPVYTYAAETAIQLILTEYNENLREIYLEAYKLPETAELIYSRTALELKKIFGPNFKGYEARDFYEMEIGSAGIMANYMAKKSDIHFPFYRKLECFLTASMRVYKVPEEEQKKVLGFIKSLDVEKLATRVMEKLFEMLEMKFDFKL